MKAKELIDKIKKTGRAPEAYSGRNMYGKYCIGCSVEAGDRGEGLPRNGMVADSLGMGMILYWPRVEAPQWLIEGQTSQGETP